MKPPQIPDKRLLAGFPYVSTTLQYADYIKECAEAGLETRLYINFGEGGALYSPERDKDTEQHALSLEALRMENIPLYWDPTFTIETFVLDDWFYRGDDVINIDKNLIPFRRVGFFNMVQGTVILIQKLRKSPPDLDTMVRLYTGITKTGRPIFISSERLKTNLREGDTVKVAYVTNYSGEGIRTFYAPSSLFSEGLALEVLERADTEGPGYRTVEEAVDRLVSSIDLDALRFSGKKDRERWERATVRNYRKMLREEGYFLETADEAYLTRRVISM